MLVSAALLAGVAATTLVPSASSGAAGADDLRYNQIQVKGSHNSYHIEPPQNLIDVFVRFQADAYLLQYTHDPLTTQLEDQGVRQFELDLFADVDGDLYAPDGVPGWKVLHVAQIDERSTCPKFTDCLAEMKAWSDANPTHVPIAVLLETKDDDDIPGGKVPDPITPALLHELDDEIRSVLPEDQLLTPDFLRGVGRPGGADGAGTVFPDPESAVLGHGWPRLDDVRGRFIFVLNNDRDDYVDGDPTLAGRVAFPPSSPGNPDAAFIMRNNSISSFADIQALVQAGYLVRSRADFPVETGLSGDPSSRDAALASGAQLVSGDYLTPTDYERYDATFAARYGLPFDPDRPAYETIVPGGNPARCNPVNGPEGCTSEQVEDLDAEVPASSTTTTSTSAPGATSTTARATAGVAATTGTSTAAVAVVAAPTFTG